MIDDKAKIVQADAAQAAADADDKKLRTEIRDQVRKILRSKNSADAQLFFDFMDAPRKGAGEIKAFLEENATLASPFSFGRLAEIFAQQPLGLSESEAVAAVAELYAEGALALFLGGAKIAGKQVPTALALPGQWPRMSVGVKKKVGDKELEDATELGRDLFGDDFPSEEDPRDLNSLVRALRKELEKRRRDAARCLEKSRGLHFSREGAVYDARATLQQLSNRLDDTPESIQIFNESREKLLACMDSLAELERFCEHLDLWKKLLEAADYFEPNLPLLETDPEAEDFLERMTTIRSHEKPSLFFEDIEPLIARLKDRNETLIAEFRRKVVSEIEKKREALRRILKEKKATPDTCNQMLHPFKLLQDKALREMFFPALEKISADLLEHYDESLEIVWRENEPF